MYDPCFEQWQRYRWENPQTRRYYEALVLKNLFDEWEVWCCWGGIGTQLGGHSVIPVNTLSEAQDVLNHISAKRQSHRYHPVSV